VSGRITPAQLLELREKHRVLWALRQAREAAMADGLTEFPEKDRPARRATMQALAAQFPGSLRELDEASAAFRHMMKARQIGKIVVSHQRVAPAPLTRPDGQYLVTGGLSGLGLEVAEWLVARGAKHISLVGRRGADSPDASAIVQRMTAAGATVSVAAVDVGDGQALGAFLTERRSSGPPLRGVVHAAGVIDDAALASQDWPRFERVLRPKVGGARNLDRLTGADPLDWFVMFSSAASLLGSPGQANYAAANTVQDVIAHQRRRLGRPGLSIDWGPWGEVGLAANPSMKERLAATGLRPFTTQEALGALETANSSTADCGGPMVPKCGRWRVLAPIH